jgi:predicted Zn-dependent protease
MKLARAILILGLLSEASSCKKPVRVYFVPIGDGANSDIDGLVDHYRQKFGLKITKLPVIIPSASDIDANRHQLIAENVLDSMHNKYSRYVENNSSILIGVTANDLYPLGQNWRFCFSWRQAGIHSAVVSTARMNLHYEGEPASQANVTSRLQKIVTKDIGIMYYNKSQNDNPHSVLFSGILGIQELDQVSEDF